ncbi:hypothetical protein L6164_028204 [Bauhinia variegata]|uniref:Uncharacterized protein n=1 Tax=Bauhinia variegata TaxID=167791 RepID=A0ACB9LWQ0_BAUVA|nr:hypothetical protein L6164_028204 [Bauhinia variegata]
MCTSQLNMESTCLENPQATNGPISRDTICNSEQIIVKANEHPEWLPAGWTVDVRTRKSGAHMGSEYKCYIEPSNGHRFYSKPEVLRYLETLKGNSCTSKKEKRCTNLYSPSKDVVQTTTVEDLPPGWMKEVRVRKGNGNRKDPYYIDPDSGYVFRSKKDALRYLESGDVSTCIFKPYKREMQDEDMFTASSTAKKQKLTQSATRRQLFVGKEISDKSSSELPDAVSSKSMADMKVSAEMSDEIVLNMHPQGDVASDPPEMSEKSNPAEVQEKDCIVNEEENGNIKNHSNPSISRNNKELSVHHRFSKRLAGIGPIEVAGTVGQEQPLQAPNRYLRKSRRTTNADFANKSSQQVNVVSELEHVQNASCMNMPMLGESLSKSDKPSEDQGVSREQHQLETEKIDDKKPEQLHLSLSQYSSSPGVNVAMKTIITGESPVLDNPHTGQSLASEASALKGNKLHMSKIGKTGAQKIHAHSNKSSNKKDQHIPRRASKRLAGFEPELMNNSMYSEKPPEYKSRKSKNEVNTVARQSEDGANKDLADHDPANVSPLINGESSRKSRKSPNLPDITDKQVEKAGDDEIYDEISASPLSFAFHYSWSDPCLEFAIKTLTGVLPIEDTVKNDPNLVSETGVIEETKLSDRGTESTSDRNSQVNSKKHKNKKELRLPRRLSKRLAGHEPELVPAERPLEYAGRKSYKDIPTASVRLNSGASQHLDASNEAERIIHASDSPKAIGVHGESSNNSNEVQTMPEEQLLKPEAEKIGGQSSNVNLNDEASKHLGTSKETEYSVQKPEAEKIGDQRSEPQLSLPFGDSWSDDPCLEFAFMTLTGALPVEDTADVLPVMSPSVSAPPNQDLLESVVEKSIDEVLDISNQSKNKTELSLVWEPSKRNLGQPELRTDSESCELASNLATGQSYCGEAYSITRNLDEGNSLNTECGNMTQLSHHSRNMDMFRYEEQPIKKIGQVLEGDAVPAEQSQLETLNHENPESRLCAPFMDSWSDPCLQFAFKTLTGAIPVEGNLAMQHCFQGPANYHGQGQRDGGSKLPDFVSSRFPQSDISSHHHLGEKSTPGQQPSMSSSFLPLENVSIHDCSGQKPHPNYSKF